MLSASGTAPPSIPHMKAMALTLPALLLASCGAALVDGPELVMNEGMVIQADTPYGPITIETTGPFTRKYSWNGKTKQFTHQARRQRWLGSKGMYRPAGDRDMHAVLEEGQQHFHSEEEVYPWLAWQQERMNWVYSSDGLVVGWREEIRPSDGFAALLVDVWQIYVQGKKPTQLKGARNDKVIVTNRKPAPCTEPGSVMSAAPQAIGNRRFSGKALDFMQEFRIPASRVENVIARANGMPSGSYIWHMGLTLNPQIDCCVCTDTNGAVVLVIP
jgi:hypothetical protein